MYVITRLFQRWPGIADVAYVSTLKQLCVSSWGRQITKYIFAEKDNAVLHHEIQTGPDINHWWIIKLSHNGRLASAHPLPPSKQHTQCWFNVGLASQTVEQHQPSIGWTCRVCWAEKHLSADLNDLSPEKNILVNLSVLFIRFFLFVDIPEK